MGHCHTKIGSPLLISPPPPFPLLSSMKRQPYKNGNLSLGWQFLVVLYNHSATEIWPYKKKEFYLVSGATTVHVHVAIYRVKNVLYNVYILVNQRIDFILNPKLKKK